MHSVPLVTFLIDGVCDEIDETGRAQRIGPGGLNYAPKDMPHEHDIVSDRYIVFGAEFVPGIMALAGNTVSAFEEHRVIRSGRATTVAAKIAEEMLVSDDASNLVLQGLFIELLGEIARAPAEDLVAMPLWLMRACEMLRDASVQDMSIQEVANEVSVHPAHLSKCFRRFLGTSPGEYARRVRLERAKEELNTTAKPLKAIALECGFADQAHFARAFKREFGHAPSKVRMRYGSN